MGNTERESINFKLPKTLTDALRTAARERNTTATDLVIQGLHHVLGQVSGTEVSVEVRLHKKGNPMGANRQPYRSRCRIGGRIKLTTETINA